MNLCMWYNYFQKNVLWQAQYCRVEGRHLSPRNERHSTAHCHPWRQMSAFVLGVTMSKAWKDIPGYEGIYKVSSDGEVSSGYNNWRILKPSPSKSGYMRVNLAKDSKITMHYVHRLVLLSFVGDSELETNHKNGDKEDNRLSNLEYCTHAKNKAHASRMGLVAYGESSGTAKVTEEEVRNIRQKYAAGLHTQEELGEEYGLSGKHVGCIVRREVWTRLET